jgi:hypothetical protein
VTPRWKRASPSSGAQPVSKVNGPVCSVKAFRNYTNVNFWCGAELAAYGNPGGLPLSEGSQMRHISVATVNGNRAELLRSLVRNAVELNRRLGDPSRGVAARARD